MKTPQPNPNIHIEFDLPLRAALIFPLSGTVQCTASDTPMKMSLFDFRCKIYNEAGKAGRWKRKRRRRVHGGH